MMSIPPAEGGGNAHHLSSVSMENLQQVYMAIVVDILNTSKVIKGQINYNTLVFKIKAANVFDMGEIESIWAFLKTLVNGGCKFVVIDMGNLEFIDSAGIGVLINCAKLLRIANGDIVMINVPEKIEVIFNPIRLQRFIKIFSSVDEAIRYFQLL